MTIYGVGYRPLEYRPEPPLRRLWPVVSLELRSLFRTRWGVVLFIVCLIPWIFSLGVLLVQMGVLQFGADQGARMQMLPGRTNAYSVVFYVAPILEDSLLQFLILTALITARAIAKDRAANALEIYWTRGISPLGYFVAKWLGSFLLMAGLCVAMPVLLWGLGVLLAPDWTFFERTAGFMPGVVVGQVLFCAALTYLAISLSALASSANVGTVLWLVLIAGTGALTVALGAVAGQDSWFGALNPWQAAGRVLEWCAGLDRGQPLVPAVAVASLGLWCALLTVLMLRRLRLSEAVG